MTPWFLVIASYLLGAIPSGLIAGRALRGIDLRQHGSGNLGATNTFRVLGARIAAPVMVADLAKGFLPTALFPIIDGTDAWAWALAYGAAAIVGHVWPAYIGFRGGKGVATATGVFLALSPVAVAMALGAWLIVLRLSGMVSLASIVAAATLVGALVLTESRSEVMTLGILVATFVIYAHRGNIQRIIRGEEHRFGRGAAGGGVESGEAGRRAGGSVGSDGSATSSGYGRSGKAGESDVSGESAVSGEPGRLGSRAPTGARRGIGEGMGSRSGKVSESDAGKGEESG
jgi:acyl phosphate:glycerol-3-phosphate acyltransferase